MKTLPTPFTTLSAALISIIFCSGGAFAAPSNDNLADAWIVPQVPYYDELSNVDANFEFGEPYPACAYGYPLKTVWLEFTPTQTDTYVAQVGYGYNQDTGWGVDSLLAVYADDLSPIGCGYYYSSVAFEAQAGRTYYFQISGLYGDEGTIPFFLQIAPPVQVYTYSYPYDPNTYEQVTFYASIYDPMGLYDFTYSWSVSDGTTSNQEYFVHQFAKDGTYDVTLTITRASNGKQASHTHTVQVRTHDVAVTKFVVPNTASANQTKTINIEIRNKLISDYVHVILTKGTVNGGEETIGTANIYVAARDNKSTLAKFNYTFTPSDKAIGKVTFKATVYPQTWRDALPADNIAIGTTKVK